MPVNQFVGWAFGGTASVYSAADYLALPVVVQGAGVISGTASAKLANTTWRQTATMAAALAQFGVDTSGVDFLDDGNIASKVAALKAGVNNLINGAGTNTVVNNVLVSKNVYGGNQIPFQNVGTTIWTVPTGVTVVHAKGWGGGGGGAGGSMAAGAGGGYFEGTYTVSQGQQIPITIGAGGVGTVGSTNNTNPGGAGGTTSFGNFAAATGGSGGGTGSTPGGVGSGGAMNFQGSVGTDLDNTISYAPGGASPFGGATAQLTGQFPGGGGGASSSAVNSSIQNAGYNGAPGLVILEF